MPPDPPHDKRILAEGKHVRFVCEDGWEYAERLGATGVVIVVAVTEQGELLLIEQDRPSVQARVIELPAGLAGDVPGAESEDLSEAARRELLEETGYRAGRLTRLTAGPPSAGMSNEIVTLFRAGELTKEGPGGGGASEDIRVHAVPLAEVDEWLEEQSGQGVAIDPKVYAGLYFAARDR